VISVDEALSKIFALVTPLPVEKIPLEQAHRRVLRAPVRATRDQPPFSASSMDGYAVAGPARSGDVFRVIGEVAAGRAFGGSVGAGEAVRIFTGAPIPQGANQVLIQEDVTVSGNQIIVSERVETGTNIRPSGGDFLAGDQISAPRRLTAVDLALIAAMNCPQVVVTRRPEVAIIATGDELVMPGDVPRDDQIIASNAFAIKALVENEGARARILPIAADTETSLRATFDLARGADLIVTIGGASVGAYDLVGPVLQAMGGARAFYKIAMRPGKPLMAGTLGEAMVIGLPGNPVSSIVCTHLFIRPALRAMQGLGAWPLATKTAKLTQDLGPNGPRAHYMRATLGPDGTIAPLPRQDSSLLSVLAQADALLIQSPKCPGQPVGSDVRFVPFSDLDT
jgi:molybdopterin molybdotransferase